MGNEGKKVENHCTRVSSLAHWGWDLWPTGVSLLANWVGSRQKPSAVFSFDSINCQLRMLCRKGREYEKTPLVPWQGKTAWFWSIDFDKQDGVILIHRFITCWISGGQEAGDATDAGAASEREGKEALWNDQRPTATNVSAQQFCCVVARNARRTIARFAFVLFRWAARVRARGLNSVCYAGPHTPRGDKPGNCYPLKFLKTFRKR